MQIQISAFDHSTQSILLEYNRMNVKSVAIVRSSSRSEHMGGTQNKCAKIKLSEVLLVSVRWQHKFTKSSRCEIVNEI